MCPRPRLEKQLNSAPHTPYSWIRARVCVIISKEIELMKGKKRGSKRRKGSSEIYFHLLLAAKIFHQHHHCPCCFRPSLAFYRAAMQTRSSDENSVCLSVRLSVTRVDCDKTVERSVQIYISYERTFSLVFWEEEWLVGGNPFYLKYWVNRPRLEQKRRFWTDNRS